MINQEKVALMTKLAAYEQGQGKENIPQSKYYREDYVSLKMINTAILVTVAYLMVLAMIVFVNVEKMMTQIANMDFVKLGKTVVFWYVVIFVVYMGIAYIVYSIKFKKVRNSLNEYNGDLKKLYALYKEEN
jgi:uncharacterized membrane protein